MALTGLTAFFDQEIINGTFAFNGFRLNAAGNKAAIIFRVVESGTIEKLHFRTVSYSSTGTVIGGIFTIDASGIYTTSAYGGMATGTVSVTGNNKFSITLATPATAVAGDIVAVVFELQGTGDFRITHNNQSFRFQFPYSVHNGSKQTGPTMNVAIEYASATFKYIPGVYPCGSSNTVAVSTATSPSAVGNEFSVPYDATLYSVLVWASLAGSSSDFEVILYDQSGATLVTEAFDASYAAATATLGTISLPLTTPYSLTANTTYRLMVVPTTTNQVSVQSLVAVHASALASTMVGSSFSRVNKASSTFTPVTDEVASVYPVFSSTSAAAGGGGGSSSPSLPYPFGGGSTYPFQWR